MAKTGRKSIVVVNIICLNREMTGGVSGKIQAEILEFAKKEGMDCIVDIVCCPALQYVGKFKKYLHLKISYNAPNSIILKKVEELARRGYSMEVDCLSFPPDF